MEYYYLYKIHEVFMYRQKGIIVIYNTVKSTLSAQNPKRFIYLANASLFNALAVNILILANTASHSYIAISNSSYFYFEKPTTICPLPE